MNVLVLGASGMLGFAIHRVLHDSGWNVRGCVRSEAKPESPWCLGLDYATGVKAEDFESVLRAIDASGASVVINAAGVIKQVRDVDDPQLLFRVNAVFPRLLDSAAKSAGFRLVHFSTDCVFSGRLGGYTESDRPDATDLYGMSKFLGEPTGPNTLVLRTSIIGRGLNPNGSLVDWFLAQHGQVRGFRKAVFSGLSVDEIGALLATRILPRIDSLSGLHHLSAGPIDKLTLLELVRIAWRRYELEIVADDSLVIDRSLDSSRLRSAIDYVPPDWPCLIDSMRGFYASFGDTP